METAETTKSKTRPLHRFAPYHTGPVLVNRMGLQLVRATVKHAARRLRPKLPENTHSETLLRDGVVVIPDFLDAETFRAVHQEYEDRKSRLAWQRDMDYAEYVPADFYEHPERLQSLKVAIEDSLEATADRFPLIRTHVVENPRVWDIVASAARRKLDQAPSARVVSWKRATPEDDLRSDKFHIKPRGEYMLHADTHYPTFKAWMYLGDVTESNGAFTYVRGSHRMTPARLRHEYETSVRVATSKKDGSWLKFPYGHIREGEEYVNKIGLKEEAICGKANTLVVADTCGFHRRGDFTGYEPRELVFLHWRHLDANFLGL